MKAASKTGQKAAHARADNPAAGSAPMLAIPYPPEVSPIVAEEAQPRAVFTPREKQVGGWLAEGKSDTEIAGILGLGVETVRTHIKSMRQKVDAVNRNTLFAWIWRNRVIFHLSQKSIAPVKYA